jgi:hypothetical protein
MSHRQREPGIDGGQDDIADRQPRNLREAEPGLQDELDDRQIAAMIRRRRAESLVLILGQHPRRSRLALGRQEQAGGGGAQHPLLDEKRKEGTEGRDAAPPGAGCVPCDRTVRQEGGQMRSLNGRDGANATARPPAIL